MMHRGEKSGSQPKMGMLILFIIFLTLPVLGPAAHGQEPDLVLEAAAGDTLTLSGLGKLTGLAWIGPDTLAYLTDIPDSVSMSGRREVHLVMRHRTGDILLDEEFTGVLDRGLAYDGEFLWSAGDAADGSSILYKLRVDTLGVDETFDAPGHRPVAMAFDGSQVWVSDRDSGRLDRIDPENGVLTRSVVSPGFSPVGLAWDGRRMWLADSGTGLLYRLSGSRKTWSATVSPGAFLHRGEDVLLVHDGFALSYVPEGQQLLIRLIFK